MSAPRNMYGHERHTEPAMDLQDAKRVCPNCQRTDCASPTGCFGQASVRATTELSVSPESRRQAVSEPIEKLPDNAPLSTEQREQLRKINELVDRTNENTRLIEAMPDFPMLPTADVDEQC